MPETKPVQDDAGPWDEVEALVCVTKQFSELTDRELEVLEAAYPTPAIARAAVKERRRRRLLESISEWGASVEPAGER